MDRRRVARLLLPSVLVLGIGAALPNPAGAAEGDLDLGYAGGDGAFTFGAANAQIAEGVALDADGQALLAVTDGAAPGSLVRLDATGSPDPDFSGDGVAVLQIIPEAVAVRGDGSIVTVGVSGGDVAVESTSATGSSDSGFGGGDGLVTQNLGGTETATDVAIDADDRIVVTVAGSANQLVVLRFATDGTLDPTFGSGGQVTLDVLADGADVERADRLVIDPAGRIVIAGAIDVDGVIARLDPDGDLDGTFSSDGIATVVNPVQALAIGADGTILTAFDEQSGTSATVAALDGHTGGPVTAWGSAGSATVDIDGISPDRISALVPLADGSVAFAGFERDTLAALAAGRLTSTGSLDPAFASDGAVTYDPDGTLQWADDLAVTGTGEYFVAGGANGTPSTQDALLLKIAALAPPLATGAPTDPVATVAPDGTTTLHWSRPGGGGPVTGYELTVQPAGTVLTFGADTFDAVVAGCPAGTPCSYTLRAAGPSGWSPTSVAASGSRPPQSSAFALAKGPTIAAGYDHVVGGDFDGDGRGDLALIATGSAADTLLRGTGAATFKACCTFAVSTAWEFVVPGDFNGDRRTDLLYVRNGSGADALRYGSADAESGFVNGPTPTLAGGYEHVVAGDFDGDGRDDVWAFDDAGTDLLLRGGSGGLTNATGYSTDGPRDHVVAADVNGDGRDDLLLVRNGAGADALRLGTTTGFSTGPAPALSASYTAIVAGDTNGNGRADVVLYRSGGDADAVLRGGSDGSLTSSVTATVDATYRPVVIDVDGDRKSDVVWIADDQTDHLSLGL